MDPIIQSLQENVINGQRAEVESLVRKALDANLPPEEILNTGLIAAMKEVGARFEAGDYYVPEMLIAARAMQTGLAILKPYLVQGGIESSGKVVIGTVKGDLHDIGKNLVSMMLEGAGFEVTDIGTDATPQKFIDAIKASNAKLVGMSALLTTTMSNMKLIMAALKEAGLRDQVKVMIGGAPVTENYAKEIGADAYCVDGFEAAKALAAF